MWGGNKVHYDFRMFKSLKELFNSIYFGEILIPAVERAQDVFDDRIEELKKHRPKSEKYVNERSNLLTNAQNFYDGREMIINGFKNKLFPFYSGNYYHDLGEKETSESDNEESKIYQKMKCPMIIHLNKLLNCTDFLALY